jgi:hypothetical protein
MVASGASDAFAAMPSRKAQIDCPSQSIALLRASGNPPDGTSLGSLWRDYGVLNFNPAVVTNAESNWWGDASGPYHPVTNPSGKGDRVSDNVDYTPSTG